MSTDPTNIRKIWERIPSRAQAKCSQLDTMAQPVAGTMDKLHFPTIKMFCFAKDPVKTMGR